MGCVGIAGATPSFAAMQRILPFVVEETAMRSLARLAPIIP
jgi:hypothetical protein